MAQTFSAYAAHAGERSYVTGELTTDRGLSFTDCQVLGIEHATGARFEIARRIEGVSKPLLLTVLTATANHTPQLQARLRDDVTVIVRLLATRPMTKNDDAVVVIGADFPGEVRRPRRFGDEIWRGFEPIQPEIASTRPKTHPWALVVDSINPPVEKMSTDGR